MCGGSMSAGEFTDLCDLLFSSLPRRDQRTRAAQYLRGLLQTDGRKSVRNIARTVGGDATDQGLHHFISASDWDWRPIRRTLARHVVDTHGMEVCVVHTMTIPKSGRRSVGVERCFVRDEGRVLNVQRAVGVWSVAAGAAYPLNWRIHLPAAWLADADRRAAAAIPPEVRPRPLEDQVVELCAETTEDWRLPRRPVVFDARELDVAAVVGRLRAIGTPLLARIAPDQGLFVADPTLTGHRGAAPVAAGEIAKAARGSLHGMSWRGRDLARAARPGRVVMVGAGLTPRPSSAPERPADLLLVQLPADGSGTGGTLWLTDLPAHRIGEVARCAHAAGRVARDAAEVAEKVGLRDYSGRSYGGWHRHVTLAGAAHALVMGSACAAKGPIRPAV